MSGWAERAAAPLLPLSCATTLVAALGEWFYTGRFFDLEATDGTCELCGQQDLRYHFEIENPGTTSSLLVGSECIKRSRSPASTSRAIASMRMQPASWPIAIAVGWWKMHVNSGHNRSAEARSEGTGFRRMEFHRSRR